MASWVMSMATFRDMSEGDLRFCVARLRKGGNWLSRRRSSVFCRFGFFSPIERRRAVAKTGDLVRIARAAYEEDEVGILELIDAYRTQREVRLRLRELIAAARQSALELERLVGEEVIP